MCIWRNLDTTETKQMISKSPRPYIYLLQSEEKTLNNLLIEKYGINIYLIIFFNHKKSFTYTWQYIVLCSMAKSNSPTDCKNTTQPIHKISIINIVLQMQIADRSIASHMAKINLKTDIAQIPNNSVVQYRSISTNSKT